MGSVELAGIVAESTLAPCILEPNQGVTFSSSSDSFSHYSHNYSVPISH